MKKIVIYFILVLFLYLGAFSESFGASQTQTAEISKIENNLYGFDYINDELKNRVARLEKTIYGKPSNGDLSARIKKLADDISADQIGLEITPGEDTFLEEEKADSTVQYPIVDEIEKKLFGTTYQNRDFHTRIVTIERKLFGKIYDVEDYSTRMDRIKTAAMPEALFSDDNRFKYDENALSSKDLSGINSSRYSSMPYGRNLIRPYKNYGDYVDSYGNTSTYDGYDDELSQLEYDTFGTEFAGDDTKTRIKRLNSARKAKKSSRKYDSQRFQQHMSTAMEIGAMILMILAMVL